MEQSYTESYRNLPEARYSCPEYVWEAEKAREHLEQMRLEVAKAEREHDQLFIKLRDGVVKAAWTQTDFERAYPIARLEAIFMTDILRKAK